MRISDWSSDVCSSDLARWGMETMGRTRKAPPRDHQAVQRPLYAAPAVGRCQRRPARTGMRHWLCNAVPQRPAFALPTDRKSVVEGKRVSVRVDPGGSRIIKKKKQRKKE